MNYQPFLDMNILVSDQLLEAISPPLNVAAVIFILWSAYCAYWIYQMITSRD